MRDAIVRLLLLLLQHKICRALLHVPRCHPLSFKKRTTPSSYTPQCRAEVAHALVCICLSVVCGKTRHLGASYANSYTARWGDPFESCFRGSSTRAGRGVGKVWLFGTILLCFFSKCTECVSLQPWLGVALPPLSPGCDGASRAPTGALRCYRFEVLPPCQSSSRSIII